MHRSSWKTFVLAVMGAVACASDSTANPSPVLASINVALSASSLLVGQSAQARATLLDGSGKTFNAGDASVAWTSSNDGVAGVTTGGLVSAVAPGNAVITGAIGGRSANAAVSVIAPLPASVASVSVTIDSSSLAIGHTGHASASVKDSAGNVLFDRSVTWSSSNQFVANVSSNGAVTGVSAGTVSVIAASEGQTGSRPVTIVASTTTGSQSATPTVALSIDATTIQVGRTAQATATLRDSTGAAVTTGGPFSWSSSNELVATVNASGVIAAVSAGTAAITASNGVASGTAVIITMPPIPAAVASITVTVASPLAVGSPASAVAIPKDSAGNALTGRSIAWATTNPSVATVSITGVVTPVSNGTTNIIASVGSKSGQAAVNVGNVPTVIGITVVIDSASLAVGHFGHATATPRDASGNPVGGKTVSWTSSNTSVLTVASDGTFNGLSAGAADITATIGTITGVAHVSVGALLTVATVTVTFIEGSIIRVPAVTHAVATLKSASGTVMSGSVTWSTSAPAVATVGADGTVTAVGPGSAVITASSGSQSGTGNVFVPDGGQVTAEPFYDASDKTATLVMNDNMDEYIDAISMGALPVGTGPRIIPSPAPISDGNPVNTAVNEVISPGRNGSGKALRMNFAGLYQSGANLATYNTKNQPYMATHYFQYWARVNFSTPLGNNALAVKWFEAWRIKISNTRIQWNTHDHLPWTGGSLPTYWQVYDQGQTATQGAQPVGPHFKDIMDNAWHRYTYVVKPNSAVGARDGYTRMWIDGNKVIDISISTVGVIPPGGEKEWCNADDIDNIVTNDGVEHVFWGSVQTTPTPPWIMDIDDFVWWSTP